MPDLTRRRNLEVRDECWNVYYGDVRVGTIAIRSGMPHHEDPWGWACGLYPGSHPREWRPSTKPAPTSKQRGVYCGVYFCQTGPRADFQAWRDQRDWTTRKYAMWQAGERLPSQKPSSLMRCPCGEIFDSHRLENTVIHVPHMTAAQE
jgi:hypothetical protein